MFEKGKYLYQGRVELAGEPYQENQPDIRGNERKAWIFPLRLVEEQHPALITETVFKKKLAVREKEASILSLEELRKRSLFAPKRCGSREVVTKQYERDRYVAAFAKKRAEGKCQLCGEAAPFIDKGRQPYLEVHHIEWLAKGGEDSISNAVALCPNCHRKMHILDLKEDREYFRRVVE